MKKIFLGLLLAAGFAACNNNNNTAKSETDSGAPSSPVTPGIDNVNGNVPDTSNAVRLNTALPKDSSNLNDSTRR